MIRSLLKVNSFRASVPCCQSGEYLNVISMILFRWKFPYQCHFNSNFALIYCGVNPWDLCWMLKGHIRIEEAQCRVDPLEDWLCVKNLLTSTHRLWCDVLYISGHISSAAFMDSEKYASFLSWMIKRIQSHSLYVFNLKRVRR
jgi:hypothetical protein